MKKALSLIGVLAVAALGAAYFWLAGQDEPEGIPSEQSSEEEGQKRQKNKDSRAHAAKDERRERRSLAADQDALEPEERDISEMSEDELVDEMSEVLRTDPKRAEKLGRAHRERFEGGSRAEEADALLVYAMYNQRRVEQAKVEAIHYYKRHPGGQYTERLIEVTRVRPPHR